MSLQFQSVMSPFANDCAAIWKNWLAGMPGNRRFTRETAVTAAVRKMTSFMVAPEVVFADTGGWGSFNWTKWRLKLNRKYPGVNNIKYGDFLEFCSTIYHETRHAEQFYRIAQGLASGKLIYPDVSGTSTLQQMEVGTGSVSSRIQAFEALSKGKNLVAEDRSKGPGVIAKWLDIPENVAQHAYTHRSYFDTYVASSRPAWFKRPTILDEVNEWMRATYKKTFSELDGWAQGSDGPYKIYRDLPEENDAHGIEEAVQELMMQRIGHGKNRHSVRRTDVGVFGA